MHLTGNLISISNIHIGYNSENKIFIGSVNFLESFCNKPKNKNPAIRSVNSLNGLLGKNTKNKNKYKTNIPGNVFPNAESLTIKKENISERFFKTLRIIINT